ncbi:MarR family winged helix-turn-helix transcriptional regulator [Kitasatospora cineracea]|uniref:DNA-binding MarR family transcriptional regulator n=1 Tax=Kitasatospora cineracea TaxID=88074 RepID=A0A3N4R7G8_9ACTN|nr:MULTISPECIES: MarR family transcriptional regulator [Kitasatospora]ROR37400.1 DNA-binding MarR family transcriptional regulator [Kitasatospora cineracea]RPE29142.1 DNA-binding MarR family transcriptional regulator [Kitasatospora cineracea]WAL75368.1 MarR family transcriptional regulator [Kitasatospora sp. YST-16]WNW41428.1 MarR family transcriptional regulator [Streptomyces sp. Li-HN-5-13]
MGMPVSDRLGIDLHRAGQELLASKRLAVEPAGLTVPQYAALFVLADSPGISGAALARACQVTPQAMAILLKHLTQRGLVERAPHRWHRNVLETRLTDRGRAALELADDRATEVEQCLADEFTEAEQEQFRTFLSRATRALRRAADDLG